MSSNDMKSRPQFAPSDPYLGTLSRHTSLPWSLNDLLPADWEGRRPLRGGAPSASLDLAVDLLGILSQGARYLPQNPPVTPKTRTPRRPTWRTAKSYD